jgi:hypothetical protein
MTFLRPRGFERRVHADSFTLTESRRISDDGAFWPLARSQMTQDEPIRERMAEDIVTLHRELKGVGHASVAALGWTPFQISKHLFEAIHIAAAAERASRHPEEPDERPAPDRDVAAG